MAASSNQGDDDGMVSGINVTPLVDITLVLLIIFMVTAKIIVSQSLPLDLPKAASSKDQQVLFAIEVSPNGDLKVNGNKAASDEAFFARVKEEKAKDPEMRAVIKADTSVQYGRVIRAIDLLKQAGVSKIAFNTVPVPSEPGAVNNGGAPSPAPSK